MIRLKDRPPIPVTLTSQDVQNLKAGLSTKFSLGQKLEFKSNRWRKDDVREALWEMHCGKCCYCERKREIKRESDVEHFRPKAEVAEDGQHPGYWWLAYEWDNYFFSCKRCNQQYKGVHFPLMPGSTRAFKETDNLADEKPVLINPMEEDPERFIGYDWSDAPGVFVNATGRGGDDRGQQTIKLLGLNEGDLPMQRAARHSDLIRTTQAMMHALQRCSEDMIESISEEIALHTSSNCEFAGFARDFYRGNGLGKYVCSS